MTMLRALGLLTGLLFLACTAALQIQLSPPHKYFTVGQSMAFECRVFGDADDIDWYNPQGEKILPDNPNISVRRDNKFTSTMQISRATVDHVGSFKCVVRTPVREGEHSVQLQLFQDITFMNAPSPQVFNEGDNANVVCDVHSAPASEIVWRKGHNLVKGDKDERMKVLKNGHLQIHNIKMTDEGEYHCEARINSFGVLKLKTINVAINRTRQRPEDFPPQIMEHPYHFTVSRGEQATLICQAKGSPTPTIEWYKDGERVNNSREDLRSHHMLLLSGTLSVFRIVHDRRTQSDRGVYVCVARNYLGEAVSRNATLEFIYPPKIQDQGTVHTSVGTPANISCEVEANPAAQMRWFKDGLQLSDAIYSRINIYSTPSVSYLEIKPESLNDFGRYSCRASNTLGTVIKEFLLAQTGTIHRPEDTLPHIVEHPSDLLVHKGEPVTLNCKVEGSPIPTIDWYQDGERVNNSREDLRSSRLLLPSGTLSILWIVPGRGSNLNKNLYVCKARNYLGEAVSRNATMEVIYPPKIQNQEAVHTKVGNPVNISCEVEANPAPQMSWFKDGLQLSDTNNMKIYNIPTISYLEVKPLSLNDFGRFSCKATNKLGTDTKEFLLVQAGTRHEPGDFLPQIVEHPSDLMIPKGDPATLNCKAEGSPTPTIEWYKNSKHVVTHIENPRSHRVLLPSGALFFLRIMHGRKRQSDQGVYMCVARNYLGEAVSRNATLEVAYRPNIQNKKETMFTWVGNPVNISCEVEAHPPPEIIWFKDGLQLSDTDNNNMKIYSSPTVSHLEVKPKSLKDFGKYLCKATNSVGTDIEYYTLAEML